MKQPVLLLSMVLWLPTGSRAQTDWAVLPATADGNVALAFSTLQPLDETIVSVLEEPRGPTRSARASRSMQVFSIPREELHELHASPAEEFVIPASALRPGSDGTLTVTCRTSDGSVLRNPWEGRRGENSTETAFSCGGTLVGGLSGPVGFVDGRVIRTGDLLGVFRVAGICDQAVVLDGAGALVVLPRGKRTLIRVVRS